MSERYREIPGQNQENKPVDIKAAEFSKKLDKVQIAAGLGLMVFTPLVALGAVFVVWNGAQHVATDKYINWRKKKKLQNSSQAVQV